MGVPRMIQGQFGSITYTSGPIDPTQTLPATPTVQFNETSTSYMGVKRHNDRFYLDATGSNLNDGIYFATYQYVDLRDLLEEKACMDDVVINVQRLYEVPYPNFTYNQAMGNIEETFVVLLGDYNLEELGGLDIKSISKAGFVPIKDPTANDSQGGLPFEVLYREVRQYVQDPSQNFTSPTMIGSQAGPLGNAGQAPTRFVNNYRLSSRTVGGYPDLLVGPGLTIIRAWSIFPAKRTIQAVDGGGATDAPALELDFLRSQTMVEVPALQFNIVGTQRKLTATETATYYSNILMKS